MERTISAVIPTAFGPLLATADKRALLGLRFCWDETPEVTMGSGPAELGEAVSAILGRLRAELDAYGHGEPVTFTVPLAWQRVQGLQRSVLAATVGVPHGATTTYGELATAVNRAGQARAVGGALRSNPWVIVVPCHRVVAADGALTGYGGGPATGGRLDVKAALLAHERAWRAPTLF
ncbi:MAG: methylated-DNA--[protein]-cysteine S-methyltransferase [Acidimicrobiales bacterium]